MIQRVLVISLFGFVGLAGAAEETAQLPSAVDNPLDDSLFTPPAEETTEGEWTAGHGPEAPHRR